MEHLPQELENLITDYKTQFEHCEKLKIVNQELIETVKERKKYVSYEMPFYNNNNNEDEIHVLGDIFTFLVVEYTEEILGGAFHVLKDNRYRELAETFNPLNEYAQQSYFILSKDNGVYSWSY